MSISSSFTQRLAVVAALTLPAVASAAALTDVETFASSILKIVNILVAIVFVLALVVFAWGVVKYITSANNPEREKEARQFLWWGVVGLFVIIAIFGLVQFIGKTLGINPGETGSLRIPKVENPNTQ